MIEPEKENNNYIIIAIIGLTIGWLLAFDAPAHDHKYNAIVTSIYDADTMTITRLNGFEESKGGVRIRFYGINAPEVRFSKKLTHRENLIEKAKGIKSRDYLRSIILNKHIVLETILDKDGIDKMGSLRRYLGIIWYKGVNINKLLVDKGYAVYKKY